MDHIDWIARDIVRRKPDYLIILGDWWDFPSLFPYIDDYQIHDGEERLFPVLWWYGFRPF